MHGDASRSIDSTFARDAQRREALLMAELKEVSHGMDAPT